MKKICALCAAFLMLTTLAPICEAEYNAVFFIVKKSNGATDIYTVKHSSEKIDFDDTDVDLLALQDSLDVNGRVKLKYLLDEKKDGKDGENEIHTYYATIDETYVDTFLKEFKEKKFKKPIKVMEGNQLVDMQYTPREIGNFGADGYGSWSTDEYNKLPYIVIKELKKFIAPPMFHLKSVCVGLLCGIANYLLTQLSPNLAYAATGTTLITTLGTTAIYESHERRLENKSDTLLHYGPPVAAYALAIFAPKLLVPLAKKYFTKKTQIFSDFY